MNVFTNKRFITNLEKKEICNICKKNMDIGTTVEFLQNDNKYYDIHHLNCGLRVWEQRLQENINAKTPQIILDKFTEIIEEIKNKK